MNACCLIGLCGATPPGVDSLEQDGWLPQLSRGAARASIRFPAPLSAVAAWTTAITGRSPSQHGIFDLFRRESSRGHRLRTMSARDMSCEAVWSHLDRHGLRSTILDYPLTIPPPRIAGHAAAGSWATSRQLRFGCHPSDLPRYLSAAGFGDLDEFLFETPAEEVPAADVAEAWVRRQIARESRLLRILGHFLRNEPSHFSAVLLRAFGTVSAWYALSPALRPAASLYFETLDGELGKLRTDYPEMNFLFMSEPGPGPCSTTFFVNDWLAAAGHFAWLDPGKLIDWTQTRAWCPLAGSGHLHLVRRDEEHPAGVADSEYREYRSSLLSALASLPEIERVWMAEELYAGPHEELAPDLVLEPKPGIWISTLARPAAAASETAVPGAPAAGILRAFGPWFHAGPAQAPVSLLDVAPLILYGLGLAIPAGLEGRVPAEIFDPAKLRADPPRTEDPSESSAAAGFRLDPEAEAEITERLRSLGYVE
jgi:predicted AlkP superfamily phosphohydrolase/phosphomutase